MNDVEAIKKRLAEKQQAQHERTRNSPDTAPEKEGNLLTRSAKAVGNQIFDDLEAGAVGVGNALNTLSGGGYGILDRAMGAGIKKLQGEEGTFSDLMQAVADERAAARERHPKMSFAGEIAGGVGFGGKAAQVLEELGVPLAEKGVRAALGRTSAASTASALENMAVESGRGNVQNLEDLADTGKFGAITGAGGQLVSEAAPAALSWLLSHGSKNEAAKRGLRKAGEGLIDPPGTGSAAGKTAAGRLGTGEQGLNTQEAFDTIGNLRDDQVYGDLMQNVAQDTARVAGSNATTNMTQPLETLIDSRLANQDAAAQSIMSDYLSPSTSKAGRAADYEAIRSELGETYKTMMGSPTAKAPIVPRKNVVTQLRRIFTQNAADLSDATATKDWLEKEVTEFMGAKKKGAAYRTNTTAKDVLSLKQNIDDKIAKHYNGKQDNFDKQSIVYLTEVKKYLNNLLDTTMRQDGFNYRDVAGGFATNEREKQLYEMGHDLFGKSAIEPSELSVIFNDLSDIEKRKFVDGALTKLNSTASGDGMASLKRALKANTLQRQKLEVLIPPDQIDAFVKDADQFMTELDNAETWGTALARRNTIDTSESSVRNSAAHTMATVGSAATGKLNSAAYSFSHMIDPSQDEAVQSLMRLYQARGQDEAQAVLNQLIGAAQKKPTNFTGAMIGNALGRTIMDQ